MPSRRDLLRGLSVTGTAGLLGIGPTRIAAEPPPETTTLRLTGGPVVSICEAPQYVAEELLRSEGFTDVQYVKTGSMAEGSRLLAVGQIDIGTSTAASVITRSDVGDPLVILGGLHVGCFEVVGSDRVRTLRDLKGKTVAVTELGGPDHAFLASMVAYVGLDPRKDINWVTHPMVESTKLLAERKIDALLALPPSPQELRAKKIGHAVVISGLDRPWSQYFCCMAHTNREFIRKYPVAAKRALRAILKAADVCAREPERAARFLVDKGYTQSYDSALETMKGLGYQKWREYDPEDTVRFYALRLHEAGMIKSSPQKIIAQSTDWRFLTELKKELKG